MIIKGENIFLKLLSSEDVTEAYVNWMRDPEVIKYLESRWNVFTFDDLKEYVKTTNDGRTNFLFGIFDIQSGKHIGNIKIGSIHPIHRNGDIGLIIGEKEFWGKNIATEAIKLITEYAFKHLNMHSLKAGMYKDNIGSLKSFEKNGYKIIGTHSKHCFCNGEYVDSIIVEKLA